jgi:hypothetical protein
MFIATATFAPQQCTRQAFYTPPIPTHSKNIVFLTNSNNSAITCNIDVICQLQAVMLSA